MVSVTVLRPFLHHGVTVHPDQTIELAAIDAAVKAQAGLVSLLHGRQYMTRDMVAAEPVQAVTIESFMAPSPTTDTPPKRRRGRPRKVR